VKLLGRKKDIEHVEDAPVEASPQAGSDAAAPGVGTTAPKGRPTRKRDAARRRGPIAPAPMTAAEARQRRKELRSKLTRQERKADKLARRAEMSSRRERMMAGEEAYLLPRDKGPVRRFVRDVVDARRSLLGLFLPTSGALMLLMFVEPTPGVQQVLSLAMVLWLVILLIDALVLARKANRLVDEHFPKHTESRWQIGTYAAGRASQIRRMRIPRPLVNAGDRVY
jgi:hypothetical protein